MDVGRDLATFIIGLVTSGVAALGVWASRRGTREQTKQTKVAHDYQAMRDRLDRAEAAEQRERDYAQRERDRAERAEDERDEIRDEFRRRLTDQEQTHRVELIHQAAKCRTETQQLKDALMLITGVVQNEIARTAGMQALNESPEHPHVDIGEWLDEGDSE